MKNKIEADCNIVDYTSSDEYTVLGQIISDTRKSKTSQRFTYSHLTTTIDQWEYA